MDNLKQKIADRLGEQKTAKLKKSLPTVRLVKNIICWTLIAVIALAAVVFMIDRISGNAPSLFGYSVRRIVSGSMQPELEVGEVILSRNITDPGDVDVGDIVTYRAGAEYQNAEITHRVVEAPHENDSGELVLVTKGDANETDDGEIPAESLRAKMTAKLPFLKWLYNFFFSIWGLLVFLFLLLLLFVDEVIVMFKTGAKDEEVETFRETYERFKREDRQASEEQQAEDPAPPEDL